jgi:putative endonuclease
MKAPAVYILASQRNGTLYIGVTSDLIQRIWQHRESVVEGFTQQHAVKTLVWYEQHETMESAIKREKTLKKWNRDWKLRLIEKGNPEWLDLWADITGQTIGEQQPLIPLSPIAPAPSSPSASSPSSPSVTPPSSPSVFIGDPALNSIVQSTTNMDGATRNEQTGFPPKPCGNDGNAGGGL